MYSKFTKTVFNRNHVPTENACENLNCQYKAKAKFSILFGVSFISPSSFAHDIWKERKYDILAD